LPAPSGTRYKESAQLIPKCAIFSGKSLALDSPSALSGTLVDVKRFLVQHDQMMKRPDVKRFYDKWLTDQLLDWDGEHSRLRVINSVEAIAELKIDAEWLAGS
jgi:hypothetical protein